MSRCSFVEMMRISYFFLYSMALMSSCRAPLSDENLKRLSNLEMLVSTAQNNLAWDEDELKQRVDSMTMKIGLIKEKLRDTAEVNTALMRYEAICANYKLYLKQAPA